MTDMPEKVWVNPYDWSMFPAQVVGEAEYTRRDTIQALRESHDRLLAALKDARDKIKKAPWELFGRIDEAITAAEKLQEGE